jgi:hypothetical protein
MSRKQNKVIKQLLTLDITSSGQTFKDSFEVDKNVERIIGVEMSSTRDDLMFYRGSQIIKINDEEFFPEGYQSSKLMHGINISANLRLYRLGKIDPGNRKVELIYTDTDNPSVAPFEAYTVILYVYSTVIREEQA